MLAELDPQKVCVLILKLRSFGVQTEPATDSGSNSSDDNFAAVYEDRDNLSATDEIEGLIEGMSIDEQRELIALGLVGRGDYAKEEWQDAVTAAASHPAPSTAAYLLEIPLISDHLEESLAVFGMSCSDTTDI